MVTGDGPLPCNDPNPRYIVNLRTMQVRQARCTRNTCVHCLPINARRRAMAMTYMQPERMIRISLAADRGAENPLQQARIRIKRVRQALSRMGVDSGEWSWTLEVNPAGTGYHAHALQRGSYIPQSALQEACKRAGAGIPYINAIRKTPSRTARYGLKGYGAAGYGLKTYRAQHDALSALDLNRGRLERHSPGFFALHGSPAPVRDVEAAALADLYPVVPGETVVCAWHEARRYLSARGRLRSQRLGPIQNT